VPLLPKRVLEGEGGGIAVPLPPIRILEEEQQQQGEEEKHVAKQQYVRPINSSSSALLIQMAPGHRHRFRSVDVLFMVNHQYPQQQQQQQQHPSRVIGIVVALLARGNRQQT